SSRGRAARRRARLAVARGPESPELLHALQQIRDGEALLGQLSRRPPTDVANPDRAAELRLSQRGLQIADRPLERLADVLLDLVRLVRELVRLPLEGREQRVPVELLPGNLFDGVLEDAERLEVAGALGSALSRRLLFPCPLDELDRVGRIGDDE